MKNVLVTPLDWGLGHATRCIPIIRMLIDRHCNVFIGGSGDSLTLLKHEFPKLIFLLLPAYHPVYPSSGSMVWKMAAQLPKFVRTIRLEHRELQVLISRHQIDYVISDNRFGCWSASIPSAFITHQSNIQMPKRFGWLGGLVRSTSKVLMGKFSVCWVPDYPDERSLAGVLGIRREKGESGSSKFIGSLTRFGDPQQREQHLDVLCILSGPEPQRSIFEKIVVEQLRPSGLRYFVVRGVFSTPGKEMDETITHADFVLSGDLQTLIEQSHCIIARSGYSTVMDLARLGKKAIFIPTPGQTEQEYLASRLKAKGIAFFMEQENFNFMTAWRESQSYKGFKVSGGETQLLSEALDQFFLAASKSDTRHKQVQRV